MKPVRVFFIVCLIAAIFVGYSAGTAHNDDLLRLAAVLSIIFFAGACLAWDIDQPTNPKGNTHE
ncbi:hypothetical protein [Leifsonia poae]|uniref:hypothetical protein n=1 Tax=Leifsonia poae TaxID=110933 RepID=UPI001CBBA2C1|nr:hypothetical protein [Leifsonia poae]